MWIHPQTCSPSAPAKNSWQWRDLFTHFHMSLNTKENAAEQNHRCVFLSGIYFNIGSPLVTIIRQTRRLWLWNLGAPQWAIGLNNDRCFPVLPATQAFNYKPRAVCECRVFLLVVCLQSQKGILRSTLCSVPATASSFTRWFLTWGKRAASRA